MITILHLSHIINRSDFIDVVIRHADRARFRMLAAVFSSSGSVKPGECGYSLADLGIKSRRDFLAGFRRLARLLRERPVDILHVHHLDPMLLGAVVTRLGRSPRLVIGRHYSDALHQLRPAWKRRAYLMLEQICNHAASRIIVPASMIRALLVDRQRVPPSKVVQIPYGFDFAKHRISSPDAPAILRGEFGLEGLQVLGSFSRLNVDKGHTYLLEALERLCERWPGVRLVLVGDGNARRELEREVLARKLSDRVVFAGWRWDVVDLMAMVDIVVQPSLHEAFSQVVVEALAMGKPLVFSDVSGARDVLRQGWNGMIVPPKNVSALEAAIEELLANLGEARAMGERGRDYVRCQFDIHSVVGQYESVYEEVFRGQTAMLTGTAPSR